MDEAGLEPSWRMTRWGGRKVGLEAWRSVMDWPMDERMDLVVSWSVTVGSREDNVLCQSCSVNDLGGHGGQEARCKQETGGW